MLRKCLFGLAGAVAIAASPAAAKPVDAVEAYNAAIDAFRADKCARVDELTPVILSAPGFTSLEPKFQSLTFSMAGLCAIQRKDWKAAYDAFTRASAYPEALDFVFPSRFETAVTLDRQEDAVQALEFATAKRPSSLGDLSPADLFRFQNKLDKQGHKDLRGRLFAALDRADYRPAEPFRSGSYLWLEYAGDLADAGDAAAAARVLGRVDVPDALAQALTDRRFASITDADPQRFDVRVVAERRLAQDQRDMAAHPELLDGPNEVAMELRALGRPEEALALLDATLPKLKTKAAFQDFSDRLPWFWDERSRTLRELGRVDEAIAALRTGAFANDPDKPDVSLILNLGDFLVWAGKPQAALDAMATADKVDGQTSPYGRMVREETRACAFVQLGKSAELKAALADIAAHASDNWEAAVDAPLCAGDLDMAAEAAIRALADPSGRLLVLVKLSQFDPPAHQTELERQMDARRAELAKRPDVQGAIAKVGRTMQFRLGRPEG